MRMTSGDDKADVSGGKEMDSDGFICRHIRLRQSVKHSTLNRRLKCIIELIVNNAVYAVSIAKLPIDKKTVCHYYYF